MATQKLIITGGAGFIGSCAAEYFVTNGYQVVLIDDLSRSASARRAEVLNKRDGIVIHRTDITDQIGLMNVITEHRDAAAVLHFAAQVGVTASLQDPVRDFHINAQGTLYLLEAMRRTEMESLVVFSSTNKVYGALADFATEEGPRRYFAISDKVAISEMATTNCITPYGCSKRTAEIYVQEYGETFGIPSVILRQSCVCGTSQHGSEEQGWVSWMIHAHQNRIPISVFGNGKQVRDLLDIRDYLDLLKRIVVEPSRVKGNIYNVGGGAENTVSILELLDWLEVQTLRRSSVILKPPRPSDQRYYASDIARIFKDVGWRPTWDCVDTLSSILTEG